MWVCSRFGLIAFIVLALGSCTRTVGHDTASVGLSQNAAAAKKQLAVAGPGVRQPGMGFAKLPDRGDLVAYPGNVIRRDGAYTWHRTDVSEQHALNSIAQGHLRLTTPTGEILDFQYDRHIEHSSGDWTWIGHKAGDQGAQTVLTFGDHAAFGTIAQSDKSPLRLTIRDGLSWMVETDPDKVAGIVNGATRPHHPDYHIVPRAELPTRDQSLSPHAAADGAESGSTQSGATPAQSATSTTTSTVDLLIGYTAGFATANGGASGALTRLNYLVDVANSAYVNSQVSAQLRLVHAMQVSYTETNTNEIALEQLSGYKSGTGSIPPNPAFTALRAARETYNADLVSLVRDFKNPEQDGCGIAWLLGGGLQGIGPNEGWDELGYSVVGDGTDAGTDGKTYFCRDESLAHELGHNSGAAHDRDTAEGDDGKLDNPDDYGAYTYSFGYKTNSTGGNFYTIMAYGDTGQKFYRTFSTPKTTFCGSHACGNATTDNARTLGNTISTVATFRIGSSNQALLRELDGNGNGMSDLMFFDHALNRIITWYMQSTARVSYSTTDISGDMLLVDAGDFDADGKSDLLFDQASTRQLLLALSNGGNYDLQTISITYATDQIPIAVGDINGDGKADIIFRKNDGRVVVWYMSGSSRSSFSTNDMPVEYVFVGAGDMNDDGKKDLLWTDSSLHIIMSTSNGVTFTNQVLSPTHSADYRVAGLTDVNDSGGAEILLVKLDGTKLVTWYMSGTTRTTYKTQTIDPAYELVGKGDFNGDHRGDLLMFNPTSRQIQMLLSDMAAFIPTLVPLIPSGSSYLMDVP